MNQLTEGHSPIKKLKIMPHHFNKNFDNKILLSSIFRRIVMRFI